LCWVDDAVVVVVSGVYSELDVRGEAVSLESRCEVTDKPGICGLGVASVEWSVVVLVRGRRMTWSWWPDEGLPSTVWPKRSEFEWQGRNQAGSFERNGAK
jgi:hypothetical protein